MTLTDGNFMMKTVEIQTLLKILNCVAVFNRFPFELSAKLSSHFNYWVIVNDLYHAFFVCLRVILSKLSDPLDKVITDKRQFVSDEKCGSLHG
jgi:hypothetical protein